MENQNVKPAIIPKVFLLGRVKKTTVTLIGENNEREERKKHHELQQLKYGDSWYNFIKIGDDDGVPRSKGI